MSAADAKLAAAAVTDIDIDDPVVTLEGTDAEEGKERDAVAATAAEEDTDSAEDKGRGGEAAGSTYAWDPEAATGDHGSKS